MSTSILIAVENPQAAEHISAWLPAIIAAGFQRVTLFHALPDDGQAANDELDSVRPLLDTMALALSAHGVETDVAFKRGDAVKWLIALADLRHSALILASGESRTLLPERLQQPSADATVPVLVLPTGSPAGRRLADLPGAATCPVLQFSSRSVALL
jgi:hypothetical protein